MLLFAGQCSLPLENDKVTMSLGPRKEALTSLSPDRAEITGENLLWIPVRSVISLEKSGAFFTSSHMREGFGLWAHPQVTTAF